MASPAVSVERVGEFWRVVHDERYGRGWTKEFLRHSDARDYAEFVGAMLRG